MSNHLESTAPDITYTITSLRTELADLDPQHMKAIERIVASDSSLECARQAVCQAYPDLIPLSHEHAAATCTHLSSELPNRAHRHLALLIDFYLGYLRPFPDTSETEPLESLLTYLRDLPLWNAWIAKEPSSGRIIGACSGQIVEITSPSDSFRVAWNEHTWVDRSMRSQGIGSALFRAFAGHAHKLGASCVAIEIDNPFLLSSDPRGFDHTQPAERRRFWIEELGQAMDPFDRINYWGTLDFGLLVADAEALPAPYEQISLDCGRLPSCRSINIALLPLAKAFTSGVSKQVYTEILIALQRTVDPNATMYPELVRTLAQIASFSQSELQWISLRDPGLELFLQNARALKEDATQRDIAHCQRRLQDPEISIHERQILTLTIALMHR